jgi:hypothetical protein
MSCFRADCATSAHAPAGPDRRRPPELPPLRDEAVGEGRQPLIGLTCSVTSFTPIPGTSCFSATYSGTIVLTDGSALALDANGVGCSVGNSGTAPGSSVSYGNPISLSGTFAITGGTGVFAGRAGGGTFIDYFAGDVQAVNLSGTTS